MTREEHLTQADILKTNVAITDVLASAHYAVATHLASDMNQDFVKGEEAMIAFIEKCLRENKQL